MQCCPSGWRLLCSAGRLPGSALGKLQGSWLVLRAAFTTQAGRAGLSALRASLCCSSLCRVACNRLRAPQCGLKHLQLAKRRCSLLTGAKYVNTIYLCFMKAAAYLAPPRLLLTMLHVLATRRKQNLEQMVH